MYDTSFDDAHSRRSDRTVLWALRVAGLIATIAAVSADAQMPGAPVLQNAWGTPGVVGAVNITGGSEGRRTRRLARGHLLLVDFSSAAGSATRRELATAQAAHTVFAWRCRSAERRARLASRRSPESAAAEATKRTTGGPLVIGDSLVDSTMSTAQIPVGVGIGWRRAIGGARGVSLYATPSYVFYTGREPLGQSLPHGTRGGCWNYDIG